MKASKVGRVVAILAVVGLVAGAFAAPAEAKKKKKKPPPTAPACAPVTYASYAADAETTTLTDAATADAPVEITIATDPGLGFTNADSPEGDTGETSHKFHNILVDTAAASAGVYVRAEYVPTFDYDLFLRTPEGPSVAYEADFNPATAAGQTPVGGMEGASAEPGASQIDGALSADCQGFTVDLASGISAGGDVALTLWLGEPGG